MLLYISKVKSLGECLINSEQSFHLKGSPFSLNLPKVTVHMYFCTVQGTIGAENITELVAIILAKFLAGLVKYSLVPNK